MGVKDKLKGYFFTEPDMDGFEDFDEVSSDEVEPEAAPAKPVEQPKARGKVVPMSSASTAGSASMGPATNMKMIVYKPMCYEDAQNIVDNLRARKPVIVNIVDLERECSQRVIDFIAGATFALGGIIRKISFGIFVVTPSNVTLVGNDDEDAPDTVIP